MQMLCIVKALLSALRTAPSPTIPLHRAPNGVFAQIFAHVHDDPIYATVTPRSFCVSAERINYTPIEFEEIKEEMKYFEEAYNG